MAALLAFGILPIANAAGPTTAPTPPPIPVNIDKNSVLILIRTTLVALQQANQTGNYSVLYGISAPGFQSANSPERLSQIFANLRAKNFDLGGVVVLEPQLMVPPEMYSNGTMRMAGFFPSVPMQVYFDLQFSPVGGQWRLVAISVDIGTSTPAAPIIKNPETAKPSATQSASVAPSQTPVAKAEAVQSPAVEVNVKPRPTPTPTPKRKL